MLSNNILALTSNVFPPNGGDLKPFEEGAILFDDMKKEIWKEVKNTNGVFWVSNLGRVKAIDRIVVYSNGVRRHYPEKYRKPVLHHHGYLMHNVNINGKKKCIYLHRLIGLAFVSNPFNKNCINHINGIKTDNRIENLEWCTVYENNLHAKETGLLRINKEAQLRGLQTSWKNKCKKVSQYALNGEYIKTFKSTVEASEETGIDDRSISRVARGEFKQTNGFGWRYE